MIDHIKKSLAVLILFLTYICMALMFVDFNFKELINGVLILNGLIILASILVWAIIQIADGK